MRKLRFKRPRDSAKVTELMKQIKDHSWFSYYESNYLSLYTRQCICILSMPNTTLKVGTFCFSFESGHKSWKQHKRDMYPHISQWGTRPGTQDLWDYWSKMHPITLFQAKYEVWRWRNQQRDFFGRICRNVVAFPLFTSHTRKKGSDYLSFTLRENYHS